MLEGKHFGGFIFWWSEFLFLTCVEAEEECQHLLLQ
jgi:hypothetical protein